MCQEFLEVVDKNEKIINDACDYIWDNPELCFEEEKAVAYLKNVLKGNGFSVEENLVGIPTAFKASFGEGKPSIGVLAEFDAVAGYNSLIPKELKYKV